MLSGIGSIAGGTLTKSLSEAAGQAVSKLAAKPLSKAIINKVVVQAVQSAGEGAEEYIQATLEPVFRNMFLNENNEIRLPDENAMIKLIRQKGEKESEDIFALTENSRICHMYTEKNRFIKRFLRFVLSFAEQYSLRACLRFSFGCLYF